MNGSAPEGESSSSGTQKRLTKKRKICGGHRAYVTGILNTVKETLESHEAADEVKIKQHKLTLKERLQTLQKLDDQILELTDNDSIVNEIEEAGNIPAEVHETSLRIDQVLIDNKSDKPDHNVSISSGVVSEASTSCGTKHVARLPKLVLKKFKGEACQWQTWWDCYNSAIHTNPELTDVDRFNYLKGLLEDGALSTIQSLPLTAANYKTAIDLLTERFDRTSVIVSSHMDSLSKLPSLFNCNDIRKLRQLYDTIEVHIRGLQSLDVSSETYGMLLVPVLLSKILEEIRLIIGRKVKDDTWDLDALITNLKEEIHGREKCTSVKASAEHAPKKQNYTSYNKQPNSDSALYLSNNRGPS